MARTMKTHGPPPAGAVSQRRKEHTMPETDWFPGAR